uniref:WLM domain-containing protein n=1 Tax=viral metagenome TaxID=1070528 RepID=A0A6C0JG13_9ZZZZ
MDKYDSLGYFLIGFVLTVCIYVYFQNSDEFQLKCIVSHVDGNKYCVRERKKLQAAADLLATITEKCKNLVEYVGQKYPNQPNVKRLVAGYNPQKISETLPTSSYTAYSENKGEKLAFCLNKSKTENENLIDENTLMFVAIHELSHIATESIGHKSEFWENFKFLLEKAKEAGIHNPVDYKKEPKEYCGMKIHDSPYYDT